MALKRVSIPSPNYSPRGDSVRLIVLHTAEGARTYQDLGAFFQGDVGVSSHVGIDDTQNTVGEYVRRGPDKAWTAGDVNPYSTQAELCAFAEWTSEWDDHPVMLENAAKWVAEEAAHFGIPIVYSTSHGVCQHVDVSGPGGHWDCGPGFPFGRVLDMAKSGDYAPPPPAASSGGAPAYPGFPLLDFTQDDAVRVWQDRMQDRGWVIDSDGMYGPASAEVCAKFQRNKGLDQDGIVGPITWDATWTLPVGG